MPNENQEWIFEERYCYRNIRFFLFLLPFAVFGHIVAFALLVMLPYKLITGEQKPEPWLLLYLPILAVTLFLCFMSWKMLRLCLSAVTVDVKIGVESIRFGHCEWDWQSLSYFGGYTGSGSGNA